MPASVEIYDPRLEQVRAQRQGIYESTVLRHLGERNFRDSRGRRADVRSNFYRRPGSREIMQQVMFQMGTGVPRRLGMLIPGTQDATPAAAAQSRKRYSDVDHLLRNRQDYEETLALYRKGSFYRVTAEPTVVGTRYFVWPLPPGSEIPRAFPTEQSAQTAASYLSEHYNPLHTGRWWTPPARTYQRAELAQWLPPGAVFDGARLAEVNPAWREMSLYAAVPLPLRDIRGSSRSVPVRSRARTRRVRR